MDDSYSDQQGDDAFPLDPTQWEDADGDGYGDNPNGTNADQFPTIQPNGSIVMVME